MPVLLLKKDECTKKGRRNENFSCQNRAIVRRCKYRLKIELSLAHAWSSRRTENGAAVACRLATASRITTTSSRISLIIVFVIVSQKE
mmetsp:Transcript_11891/g.17476  ORF Transcript_11891/g.17476 Transcript_11891/m.17476 type:complete len:88 (-) Transcript_11891:2063-2326(-)